MSLLDQHIEAAISHQDAQGLTRTAPEIQHLEGMKYRVNGTSVTSFCSNDFLGYGATLIKTQRPSRSSAAASRLVHGSHQRIRELEERMAQRLGYEDAVYLASGYQANIAALAQLPVPENSEVYSDQNNHASIIDGLRLRRCNPKILPHLDAPPKGSHWWITESRYSMDGDAPSLTDLDHHLDQQGFLYLDEAHRFGIESAGQGLAAAMKRKPQLGNYPLGKAFGLQGAILAGDKANIRWIRQFSRAYTYTTAPSPFLCDQVLLRMQDLFGEDGDRRRDQLQRNIRVASEVFDRCIQGPILSLPIGDNNLAVQASHELLDHGFHIQAIRPPTVAPGTARLRITLSALHEPEEIQELGRTLTRIRRSLSL